MIKWFKRWKRRKVQDLPFSSRDTTYQGLELDTKNLKTVMGQSKDIEFHSILVGGNPNLQVTVAYVDGLIDKKLVSESILKPLAYESRLNVSKTPDEVVKLIEHGALYAALKGIRNDVGDVINDLLTGSTVIVFDKLKVGVAFKTEGFDKRAITEPVGENVIKGAKDAFVETLRVNTATVRRKIKSSNLIIQETVIGKQTLTPVAIVYMRGTTNVHIVNELIKRLNGIRVDQVVSPGFIEEYIIDNPFSVFPQVYATERPDRFCANIVEGRVGVIIDGLPITYIVPGVLSQFLQAPEDYSQNYLISSAIRVMRYVMVFVTLLLPAFYISVTTFHHEMLPTNLALTITASKEGVPFPSFIEVIIMLLAFEALLEAGLRLPKSIGQAVTIVGALVVGEAAVNAKLVSPAIVVIIALTAIASFTMPNQDLSNALRIWRFVIVILSSILGLVGLSFGLLVLLYHLSQMETFGVPYLSPFVANNGRGIKNDTIFRVPLIFHKKRPSSLKVMNKRRQK